MHNLLNADMPATPISKFVATITGMVYFIPYFTKQLLCLPMPAKPVTNYR